MTVILNRLRAEGSVLFDVRAGVLRVSPRCQCPQAASAPRHLRRAHPRAGGFVPVVTPVSTLTSRPLRAAVAFAFRAEISKGERYLPIPHTRRFVRSPSASPPRVSSRPGTCPQQFGRTSLTCHAAGLFTLRWVWPRTRVKRAVRWRHRRSLRRRRHPPARSHRARAYHHDRHE